MGPPEWGLHRIILFFLYSSSLLCSEPTHVFGRTRWLTLANGNQKTRVKVTWLSHTPSLEVLHPAPRAISFFPGVFTRCIKKLQHGFSEVRVPLSQATAFTEWKKECSGLWKGYGTWGLESWIWVQIQLYHLWASWQKATCLNFSKPQFSLRKLGIIIIIIIVWNEEINEILWINYFTLCQAVC